MSKLNFDHPVKNFTFLTDARIAEKTGNSPLPAPCFSKRVFLDHITYATYIYRIVYDQRKKQKPSLTSVKIVLVLKLRAYSKTNF